MKILRLKSATPWAPTDEASPVLESSVGTAYLSAGNGTNICAGGWDFDYGPVKAGTSFGILVKVKTEKLNLGSHPLTCTVHWSKLPQNGSHLNTSIFECESLQSENKNGTSYFKGTVTAPSEASSLVVRCSFRWSKKGKAFWKAPVVTVLPRQKINRKVRIAIVTGRQGQHQKRHDTTDYNLGLYSRLCERVCRIKKPNLVVLPETALQWNLKISGSPGYQTEVAFRANSREVQVFQRIARKYKTRIVLPIWERDGGAIFNTSLLISSKGAIEGKYRKVHLWPIGEDRTVVSPGTKIPVYETEIGKIGMIICQDNSAPESARTVGLKGGEILAISIMGDHRADRFTPGKPVYHEDRWKAIFRTRAIDNQLYLAIARNEVRGSCIIDPEGEILVWNDGTKEFITADIDLNKQYRSWFGIRMRDIDLLQRRPLCYETK